MKDKSNIWVKSYPFPKEIIALADLGKQNICIEVFLGGDQEKNEDCANLCRNYFPSWGIEGFVYQDEEKRNPGIIYDVFSSDKNIRDKSMGYFLSMLALAEKYGAKHLQIDGNDGYRGRPGQDINSKKQEFIQQRLEFIESLKKAGIKTKILYENIFPIDDPTSKLVFTSIGHNLSDFSEGSLPLEYDIAHHAIALDVYSRADQFNFPLTEEEKELAKKVKKQGMTTVMQEQLQNFPEQIYFTHLSNATPFALLTKSDVMYKGSKDDLFDLEVILPILMEKSLNITPEVGDNDFEKRPNLRKWIKRLQDF